MRVLIYGGRDFIPTDLDFSWLNSMFASYNRGELTVISGEARGADTAGRIWAIASGHEVERYPADWNTHGKAAGYIRNQQMLDSGVDVAVQFPGGRGTADMRRRLDKAGVKVIEYKENYAPTSY